MEDEDSDENMKLRKNLKKVRENKNIEIDTIQKLTLNDKRCLKTVLGGNLTVQGILKSIEKSFYKNEE